MTTLLGKTAWITGGASGIGRACALSLWRAGATIVVSARTQTAIDALVRECGNERVIALPLDVADRRAVEAAARQLQERVGAIDILVNAAGINVANRKLTRLTPADWDQVIDINLNGAFYCMHAVLPGMRDKGAGTIINISSWAGRFASALTGAAYGASKHAMAAMTMSVAMEECANGIRACAIYPGETATPILVNRPTPPSAQDLARMLQPEDVAAAVDFVLALPARATVNELVISPTWNRAFLGFQPPPRRD
ncbi:putative oxidoreductase [Cupriavidus yeoncheonensis]|uniref:Oxidoreductase n=1 Tax=Cupriavidus yeoncheonensis TaxID=1462994 RepID=A0A916J205_9BURK|nr:SDR family oxidoreductase [Cupriavidus yeoncheonensis]CAG2157926.1 putative oxidoreductase [Cupriavidus yeoncheonensis]